VPPSAWIGSATGWTTSPSGAGGESSARFSAIVLPGDGDRVAVQHAGVEQLLHHDLHTAHLVEVLHHELAGRPDVHKMRDGPADAVEVVQLELDPGLVARSPAGEGRRSSSRRAP
jgi:hypothetical protein